MRTVQRTGWRGFSLIELLVVIMIVSLLAGILLLATGPARERAREAHCINNLRQIGMAIQMYRQDAGGGEYPEATTAAELGLPPTHEFLYPYVRSRDIFNCPSEYWPDEEPGQKSNRTCSYYQSLILPENPPPPLPKFSELVRKHGEETGLFQDPHHGTALRTMDRNPVRVLVLRLSGQVQSRMVPSATPGWDW